MIPFIFQAPEAPSGGRSELGFLVLGIVLVFLVYVAWRKNRATAGVTLDEARRELDRLREEGGRDVRTEAHVGAFLSWCTAYAVLLLVSFVLAGFVKPRSAEESLRRASDLGTTRIFAVLAAAEGFGLWMAGRGISRGSDRARLSASGVLTFLALTAVASEMFWIGRQPGAAKVPNLIFNGAVALYAVAGATFLLLPRCARLCSPDYLVAAGGADGPATRAALNLARTKSPFSWGPIVVLAGTAILMELLKIPKG